MLCFTAGFTLLLIELTLDTSLDTDASFSFLSFSPFFQLPALGICVCVYLFASFYLSFLPFSPFCTSPCRYQSDSAELGQWLSSALDRLEFWSTQSVTVPQELETVRDHLHAFLVKTFSKTPTHLSLGVSHSSEIREPLTMLLERRSLPRTHPCDLSLGVL